MSAENRKHLLQSTVHHVHVELNVVVRYYFRFLFSLSQLELDQFTHNNTPYGFISGIILPLCIFYPINYLRDGEYEGEKTYAHGWLNIYLLDMISEVCFRYPI